jgi:two-component system phosphate regulon response regulator PhoB
MALASILVVDSDFSARSQIAKELRELGHEVSESENAGSALRLAHEVRPDLIVCEFSLPDLAGIEFLSDIRRSEDLKPIRVLMTSERDGPDDVVAALSSGADDYVSKPIDIPELVARVGACLRRPASPPDSGNVGIGGISIDDVGHRVIVDEDFVSLAPREYRLLQFFLNHPDRVFSRRQLLIHVWDRDASVGSRTVDVHIRRLRSVLERYGYDRYLQTVRGTGYRFSVESQARALTLP